ncbi:hypothetical protein NDU88_005621 [Pleurodeles waltl]|uniref:Uncharacterized protein n=1 Tax=Pleurodeles waltl TaxID=8319 RepID=A0AAV7WZ34_PLEWA|nr:hypothetical protein NDU88_005621 [Pleurodeles waltl]
MGRHRTTPVEVIKSQKLHVGIHSRLSLISQQSRREEVEVPVTRARPASINAQLAAITEANYISPQQQHSHPRGHAARVPSPNRPHWSPIVGLQLIQRGQIQDRRQASSIHTPDATGVALTVTGRQQPPQGH